MQRLSELLAIPALTEQDLEGLLAQGFPTHTVDALVLNGFGEKEIDWIVSRRGLNRREQLTPEESARLLQLATVFCVAEAALGSRERAWEWLTSPQPAYGGLSPIELSKSMKGAAHVREILGQWGHHKPRETVTVDYD